MEWIIRLIFFAAGVIATNILNLARMRKVMAMMEVAEEMIKKADEVLANGKQ